MKITVDMPHRICTCAEPRYNWGIEHERDEVEITFKRVELSPLQYYWQCGTCGTKTVVPLKSAEHVFTFGGEPMVRA